MDLCESMSDGVKMGSERYLSGLRKFILVRVEFHAVVALVGRLNVELEVVGPVISY